MDWPQTAVVVMLWSELIAQIFGMMTTLLMMMRMASSINDNDEIVDDTEVGSLPWRTFTMCSKLEGRLERKTSKTRNLKN